MVLAAAAEGLPIQAVLSDVLAALDAGNALVLQAPPGAGKTTIVPLALLQHAPAWLQGTTVLVAEPRRLAARAAATRMAALLGERLGARVGYRTRVDSVASRDTVVLAVTTGVLLRRLQRDPALRGVGAVVLDEFHERSVDADLALTLCAACQAGPRPDLRVLVMSATLGGGLGERIAALLAPLPAAAPLLVSKGRTFPVHTVYLGSPGGVRGERGALERAVAAAALRALAEAPGRGSVLCFLPGINEIRKVKGLLEGRVPEGARIRLLHGALSQSTQDAAVLPEPDGARRIVLATSIAEASLTVAGVRAVVDAGLARRLTHDFSTGLSRLMTVRASRSAVDQRQGRAGRLGSGLCFRLWAEQAKLPDAPQPEIQDTDLASLALALAVLARGLETGAGRNGQGSEHPGEGGNLRWLDPPPAEALAAAQALLRSLGAVDNAGTATAAGRRMADLGEHPRLARMVLAADDAGLAAAGCVIAAVLGERDVFHGHARPGADLAARLRVIAAMSDGQQLAELEMGDLAAAPDMHAVESGDKGEGALGALVAAAYPDRVAQRRDRGNRARAGYTLSNGASACLLNERGSLAAEPLLAVASLGGEAGNNRNDFIYVAAALRLDALQRLESACAGGPAGGLGLMQEETVAVWAPSRRDVLGRWRLRLGCLVLQEEPVDLPDAVALPLQRIDWDGVLRDMLSPGQLRLLEEAAPKPRPEKREQAP
ncbi:hypothetical protein WJX81_004581 [Elliptochloris bilobata]|uniref:ATP-dependent helicase HrpB n=1 Tax=Elliptochloris bilobata TaxID=381761 RepID=A0AAW1SIH3_9CHLO